MSLEKRVKIRINLVNREFEIDAESDFVTKNFGERINAYLDIIQSSNKTINGEKITSSSNISHDGVPDNFGEYFNRFPKTISNVDKLLIASYYLQLSNDNNSFTVKDASDVLIEQGIKLSNSGVFNNSNLNTKKIFKLNGKVFRVSDIGKEYIKNILINS